MGREDDLDNLWSTGDDAAIADMLALVEEGERAAEALWSTVPTPEQMRERIAIIEDTLAVCGLRLDRVSKGLFNHSWQHDRPARHHSRFVVSTDHLGVSIVASNQIPKRQYWDIPLDDLRVWLRDTVQEVWQVYEQEPSCACRKHDPWWVSR